MAWIIFDEADHYIPAPHFCLPDPYESLVCLRDYQEDCNLVLLIASERMDYEDWRAVDSFNSRQAEYQSFDAKVLAVISGDVRVIKESLTGSKLSFPLLSDPEGKVRQAYAGLMDESLVRDEDILIFVLDRYNAPYAAWIGREFSDPFVHQEVQSWLAFIGVQCPE